MNLRKLIISPWLALLTMLFLLGIQLSNPVFVESVRLRYFDTVISGQAPVSNNIHTVNIDEAALAQLGQWPLPRDQYAAIIQDLYRRGAGLVIFNVLMPDTDRSGKDSTLAATMQQVPVVLPTAVDSTSRNQPRAPGSAVIGSEYSDILPGVPGLVANIPELESAAAGTGVTTTMPEIDGVVRRSPTVVVYQERVYPTLPIEIVRLAASASTIQIKLNPLGVDRMRVPQFGPIATDSQGRVWIDWSQRSQSHSLTQLPDDFEGGIVIVGLTAPGLANPVPTALGAQWPHEVHAAVTATVLNSVTIGRPNWALWSEAVAFAAACLLLLVLTRNTVQGLIAAVALPIGVYVVSQEIFARYLMLFDPVWIIAGLVLVSLHAYGVKFLNEYLQKQQIKKQFGTYLSPAMVEKLQKNPELLTLGGESRELSIMFTDVRGFTSISEHYGADVQGLTKIMNRYMTAMTRKIIDNNGTLDKYIGDAQMAFWNAPLDDAEHATNSVRTALEMIGSLDTFNEEISQEGVPPFGMGLGINTATVVVGNMGSDQRFDYTCLGDGVNLASRLEGQSKTYGVKIVLGSRTAELVQDQFFVIELDTIAVKGKKQGVTIYTVLSRPDGAAQLVWDAARQQHNQMLNQYRHQRWDSALNTIQLLLGQFDGNMDDYYTLWQQRIEEMRGANLPADWDGTYIAQSK